MRKILKYIILSCGILIGCYEEEVIHGREGGEPFYTLPQGDHDYDSIIVDWFERCGFYILYNFQETDLYWNNTEWEEGGLFESHALSGHLKGKPANPDYVGDLLEMIDLYFFQVYPEEILTKEMPLKLLLCSELQDVSNKYVFDAQTGEYRFEQVYTDMLVVGGYDYIAVNGANSGIETLTDSMRIEYSLAVNELFLSIYGTKSVVDLYSRISHAFFDVSVYDGKYISRTDLFKYGFLNTKTNTASDTEEIRKQNDMRAYMVLVGYPLSVLEATPGDLGDDNSYPSLRGVLHPNRDINGLVRQKYEIMVEFLKEMGIDVHKLQYPME